MPAHLQVRSERAKAEMPPRRKKGDSTPITAPPKVCLHFLHYMLLGTSQHCKGFSRLL